VRAAERHFLWTCGEVDRHRGGTFTVSVSSCVTDVSTVLSVVILDMSSISWLGFDPATCTRRRSCGPARKSIFSLRLWRPVRQRLCSQASTT